MLCSGHNARERAKPAADRGAGTIANPCQFGSSPASGSPAFFQFTDADVYAAMGSWSSEVSLDLLGISSRPYDTAAFCADPPDFDFPTPLDYAWLTSPTLAAVSGAYQRFKNLILAHKWSTIAVCNNAPLPILPNDPPAGYIMLYPRITAGFDAGDRFGIYWIGNEIPAGATNIAMHVTGGTAGLGVPGVLLSPGQGVVGWHISDFDALGEITQQFNPDASGRGAWRTDAILDPSVPHHWVSLFVEGFESGPETVELSIAYKPHDIGVIPPPPVVVAPPTDFPPPPAADGCDLAGICASIAKISAKLEAMDARIQHTNAALAPLAPIADTPPVLPVPSDHVTPPGTPDVPTDPILKPLDAVGAIVQCTTIPATTPHYGADPAFYPSLAHIIPITDLGPLAGIAITRNPQVIMPIPTQVISLAWDPQPGVVGQVQWLRAPK